MEYDPWKRNATLNLNIVGDWDRTLSPPLPCQRQRNIHIIFHKVEVIVSLLSFSITGTVVTPVQQYQYNQEWGEVGHTPITINKNMILTETFSFNGMACRILKGVCKKWHILCAIAAVSKIEQKFFYIKRCFCMSNM